MLSRWTETARSIGEALLQVLAAEADALQRDLTRSGRALRGGLILLAVAGGVAFWTLGLGLWAAVELLSLRLPAYGAALVVFTIGLLVCMLLLWLGRRKLRRIEMPMDAVRRRGREHAEWWRQTVLPGLGEDSPPARRRGPRADDESE